MVKLPFAAGRQHIDFSVPSLETSNRLAQLEENRAM